MAIKGAFWWHYSSLGLFVNSTHFWSVILFFLFMAVHLFHGFWMGAWRGGQRWFTWMTGVTLFFTGVVTAFFGYNLQTNFGSQWIGTQGKDAVNATGLGGIVNILDAGQMYSLHVILMPLVVAAIVVVHVLWVRKDGVVPPYARTFESLSSTSTAVDPADRRWERVRWLARFIRTATRTSTADPCIAMT